MKTIVVTGGSGQFGRKVVDDLGRHGYAVLSLDRTPHPDPQQRALIVDLKNPGDLYQTCRGAWGLVHLAAHIAPNITTDTATFSDNATMTYNVMKVATDLGIERLVLASSIGVYGYLYGLRDQAPDYLPVDENHPSRPVDPYGLSKVVGEQIGASFARSHAVSVVSLRLPGINYDPKFERIKRIAADPAFRKPGFWSYVDVRDAAVACRLSLEWGEPGHHIFNVAARKSNMRESTADLVRRFYPAMSDVRLAGISNWSGIDSSRIEQQLGFIAQYHWEDADQ
jgi:nucleoside-diphosphate-sugar epimerase